MKKTKKTLKAMKTIFSKDFKQALINAREDERIACEKEKIEALEKQKSELDGYYSLKLKELETKIMSLEQRSTLMLNRDKKAREELQRVREAQLALKRLIVDMADIANDKRQEFMQIQQSFLKMFDDISNVDKLIGVDK